MRSLDEIESKLLKTISNLDGIPEGAYNFRLDGKGIAKESSKNIEVITRPDKKGLTIYVKDNTKEEDLHILVMLKAAGLTDYVINDFYIGKNAEVNIIAGCGIYNCGASDSRHDGLHNFYLEEGAKVHYIEKHYAFGPGAKKILNPRTFFSLAKNSELFAEIEQIRGIDSSRRETSATLEKNAKLRIVERTLTQARQHVESIYNIELNGLDSSVDLDSRTVAEDFSSQLYTSKIIAKVRSKGHSSCDTILKDSATAQAIPELLAETKEAELIHEAAIGRLNKDQLIKLMTLGFTPREAESKIINGFLA